MARILVTGGSGFIGSVIVKTLIRQGHEVVNVDCITYAAVGDSRIPNSITKNARYRFEEFDVADPAGMTRVFSDHRPALVIHAAAETHVDRSIDDATLFLRTNIQGTYILLEMVRQFMRGLPMERPYLCYVSTDEVYGPWVLGEDGSGYVDGFTEAAPLKPHNPYSASKAAAEHLVRAYAHTHSLPVVITRGSNTFGTHQVPEKFLPMMIRRAARNESLPIYGDGQQTREWMHVQDHANGIIMAAISGRPGRAYNLGPSSSEYNIHIAQTILQRMGKPASLIEHVADRPGHDRAYAICTRRAEQELKWECSRPFLSPPGMRKFPGDGLDEMIAWYTGDGAAWCEEAGRQHLERKGTR